MTRPEPPPGGVRLLHCSLERTLLLVTDPASGQQEIVKLLLRGSPDDAQHECMFGSLLTHGVVGYLGAQNDPAVGRPSVRMRYHAGANLDDYVARHGAVAAADACRMLAPVARTLASAHGLRTATLPRGFCHGDVKPGNLLWTGQTTLLLDFEHAGPTHQRACTGTPGFAGPEAEGASPLHPSFDVYGLGATLHWLLSGWPPGQRRLRGQHPELLLLLEACLGKDPMSRPSAATVAEALEELAVRLRSDPREAARAALLAGDCATAAAALGRHPDPEVQELLDRRRRLLERRPACLASPDQTAAPDEPDQLEVLLRRWTAVARRFPRHPATIAARHAKKQAAAELLAARLPQVFACVRDERFDAANELLAALRRLVHTCLQMPGRFSIPGDQAAHMPTLLQRAPATCLEQEQQRLDAAVAEHHDLLETLHAAEAALALDDAASAIDGISSRYGGTSEAVARHRDRLHRMGFYVERIARGHGNVERLYELVPDEDPAPLLHFVDECAAAVAHSSAAGDRNQGSIGLRSLHLALGNLSEEFPAVAARTQPALACLDRALAHVTDEAWALLADAQAKLAAEPVPVRPLQLALARLDTFRALEAFVDRPQHSRSVIVDRLETLRLRLEQAQATRDRLARGAEQALAKGHWTTGLFDMERAATHLQDDDQEDRQAAQLRQKLAEARRRKQEIEQAQRRKHELASRYAALQDDPHSTTAERLQTLREQRDCLQFLAVHAHKERGGLYARDLRDVELGIAQEQAQQAEAELDSADSPVERHRIAAQALAQLESIASDGDPGSEMPGRLLRLLEHWRRRRDHESRAAARRLAEERMRRRRRWLTAAAGAVAVLVSLAGWRLLPGNAMAAARDPLAQAVATLPATLRELGAPITAAARAAERETDATAYLAAIEAALRQFLAASAARAPASARSEFVRSVWDEASSTARRRFAAADGDAALEAAIAAATRRLQDAGPQDGSAVRSPDDHR